MNWLLKNQYLEQAYKIICFLSDIQIELDILYFC